MGDPRIQKCKVCKNRSFDLNRGIVCKLTNEKPTFTETCPSFIEDENEVSIQTQYRESIETAHFDDSHQYSTARIGPVRPNNAAKANFRYSKGNKVNRIGINLGMVLLVLSEKFPFFNSSNKWLYYSLLGVGVVGIVYNLIRYFNRSIQLSINQEGVTIKKEVIPWHKIRKGSVAVIQSKYSTTETLIIKLTNGESKRINVHKLDADLKTIGGTFEYFKQSSMK